MSIIDKAIVNATLNFENQKQIRTIFSTKNEN
jgi:hypothetical protein